MFLSSSITIAFFAAGEGGHPWWNYPGLELWKFVNLFLFILAGLFAHRLFGRPVREGLRGRRESIKQELERARVERDQAVSKLAEVEARFGTLDAELNSIRQKSQAEAQAEKERIRTSTDEEIAKIRDQARRELDSASKAARQELRRFAAEESVRMAEGILKKEIGPADDERLATMNVEELRRTSA